MDAKMSGMPALSTGGQPKYREHGITRKEAEVLAALAERLTNAEIAARLYVSNRTVESHVSSLLHKLSATNRRELADTAPEILGTTPASDVTPRPTGTVTFLFTDIIGSTELWDRHPDEMPRAVERHDEILRSGIEDRGGQVFATGGDGVGAVFARAVDAVMAAADAQIALSAEPWSAQTPIRVRIGVHTGEAHERAGDYFGSAVNRAARIMRTAGEAQVLVSSTTAATVADIGGVPDMVDLGERRLRGLRQPQRLFELLYTGHPPSIGAGPGLANNLPSPVVRLVGRDSERALLLELLDEHRLVTLVGAGGIGKTSLAEEVAVEAATGFSGGTWFIGLASLGSGDAVPSAFAAALGVQPRRDASVTESIVASYRDQHALIIVDNCEHVIEDVARVVEAMLRGCPALRMLATSREPLALRGERRLDLLSLAVPGDGDTPAEIAATASVQLLCERAAEAGRHLNLDSDAASVIGELCRLLGGIPLAIELAASQLRVLRPLDALQRLEAGLGVLRDERRDVPDRHRTLHATMDWSYRLLGADEQHLFDRLAVFLGGFTLNAAEAVCSGETVEASDIAELLWRLVDRSMVHIDDHDGASRYAVLEPLRQHALGHLDPSEQSRLAGRHLTYFRDVAESSTIGIRGSDEAAWVDRLNADFQNLRVAVRHGVSSSRLDDAARLVAALHDYAIWRQRFEVGDWARDVLGLPGAAHHPAASVLFATAGWGRCIAGEFDKAIDLANHGLEAERRTGQECGWLHDVLGHAHFFQANNDAGLDHSHAEIDRARTAGDRYRLAYVLADNAMHQYMAGNSEAARTGADEALALAEAQQCPSLIGVAYAARSMTQLDVDSDEARAAARTAARVASTVDAGWTKNVVTTWLVLLAVDRTDRSSDLVLAREAIDSYWRAGDEVRARTVAYNCLPVLAAVLGPDGVDELAQLHGANQDRPKMKGAFIDEYLTRAIADIESVLGSAAFAAAVGRGRELTTAQALGRTITLLDQAVANASPGLGV